MSFANRLQKRHRHLKKFASRWPTNAFRVYDRDMPEYPWTVDIYGDHVYVQQIKSSKSNNQIEEVLEAVAEKLGATEDQIHFAQRQRHNDQTQYQKRETKSFKLDVFEGDYTFRAELESYIDTGLFLDHRNLRRMVSEDVKQRAQHGQVKVLNLFCYTGAFSVWAAGAGAQVTSVDLSNTYLDWAKTHFDINNLSQRKHAFLRSDVMRFLPQHRDSYDIIVLDPPSYSKSKKMEGTLDIQRDYPFLVNQCLGHLNRGGILYFSTNMRKFELQPDVLTKVPKEISHLTVPEDFRAGIHRTFKFQ